MLNILLVEDHLLFRGYLKRLLAQETDFQLAGETSNGEEAVRLVKEMQPDVLVTDLMLPGLHGLKVVHRVHLENPQTRIVVVSIHDDEPYVTEAFRNGALAYVLKDFVVLELADAIRAAAAGRRYSGSE